MNGSQAPRHLAISEADRALFVRRAPRNAFQAIAWQRKTTKSLVSMVLWGKRRHPLISSDLDQLLKQVMRTPRRVPKRRG